MVYRYEKDFTEDGRPNIGGRVDGWRSLCRL